MRCLQSLRYSLYCLFWLAVAYFIHPTVIYAQNGDTVAISVPSIINNTNNMRVLGHIGGPINEVFVVEHLAYIGEAASLTILDISQPATPIVVGRALPLPERITGIVVRDKVAYIIAGHIGLHLFDVHDPNKPRRLGYFDTPGEAKALTLSGNYAYVADGGGGVHIIDIADATAPKGVGVFDTLGTANDIVIADHYAYIADGDGGMRILDITDASYPKPLPAYNTQGFLYDIDIAGHFAYLAIRGRGVRIVDIADPLHPQEIGVYPTLEADHIQVTGSYAIVLDHDFMFASHELEIVDVTTPSAPSIVGKIYTQGVDFFIAGNYAYVASGEKGIQLVDIAVPTMPVEKGTYNPVATSRAVFVQNHYAYVADNTNGLRVVDVANPAIASVVSIYKTPGSATAVHVDGNRAIAAIYMKGISVINVENPLAPQELGFYKSDQAVTSLAVDGDYVFTAEQVEMFSIGPFGLRAISTMNPSSPTSVGFYDSPGIAVSVYVAGKYAYLADWLSGLRIINIEDPTNLREIGSYDTPGYAHTVYVAGKTAYVADGGHGLQIIDVSNPQLPVLVGAYDPVEEIEGVFVTDNNAYLLVWNYSSQTGGLRVVNVSNPKAPMLVGAFDTQAYPTDVYVSGKTTYLTVNGDGLFILRYPACYQLSLRTTGTGETPLATIPNSPACSFNEYLADTRVTLTAQPAPNWRVASWSGTNNDGSTSMVNQLVMPAADYEVTVNYAPICYELSLTYNGEGNNPSRTPLNSVGCNAGQYITGEVINLTAAPGPGYIVGSWSGTANDASKENQNIVTMPATNHTVGVNYGKGCYPLALTHTGNGNDPVAAPAQSSACAAGNYHFGETIALSASPGQGWQVSAWSGTGNNTITTTTNALIMPANQHTALVHYGEIPIPSPGDNYESNNRCTLSRPISTDGSEVQEHTFHAVGDVDWIRFDAAAGAKYRVEVTVPPGSPADLVLEPYRDCASSPDDPQAPGFNPGARVDIVRTVSGPTYVRLSHLNASVAGDQVRYQISVRKLGEAPQNRALIIVAGRLKEPDEVQANINTVAKRVYRLFQRNGYHDEDIRLLGSDANLPAFAGSASKTNLKAAITEWAAGRVANGVLTLYLVDHGTPELFYLDGVNNETLTPSELNEWLTQLERAVPGVKVNVIIEACESGSFINLPGSISRHGRIILTSNNATDDAKASNEGAYFSDHLLTALQEGANLAASFQEAKIVAQRVYAAQEAWLDGNGNGIANEAEDNTLAAQRGFAYAGTLPGDTWAPYIFEVKALGLIVNGEVSLRADVRDDVGVKQVRVVIYPPDYTPPPSNQTLQKEVLTTQLFSRTGNDTFWEAKLTGLTKPGVYRLLVFAEDEAGLIARPVGLAVADTLLEEHQLFLPIVQR